MERGFEPHAFECGNCIIENIITENNDVIFLLRVPPYSSAKLRFVDVEEFEYDQLYHQKIFCVRSNSLDSTKTEYRIEFSKPGIEPAYIVARNKIYSE